jgi:hypothetical protein
MERQQERQREQQRAWLQNGESQLRIQLGQVQTSVAGLTALLAGYDQVLAELEREPEEQGELGLVALALRDRSAKHAELVTLQATERSMLLLAQATRLALEAMRVSVLQPAGR